MPRTKSVFGLLRYGSRESPLLSNAMTIRTDHFRNVPDWPRDGIQFKDIGPILSDPGLLSLAAESLLDESKSLTKDVDFVIAPEARGFLFGATLALGYDAGFIPARKPGKLPPKTRSVAYELEYGEDHLHLSHREFEGARVLIHDDLLATGGTAAALVSLVRELGAEVVGAIFLAEIEPLNGRTALIDVPVASVVQFT